jgi:hypothetical protein
MPPMKTLIIVLLVFLAGALFGGAVVAGSHVDPYIHDLGENWLTSHGVSTNASSRTGLWVAMIECRDVCARERDRLAGNDPSIPPPSDPSTLEGAEYAAVSALIPIFEETGYAFANP